MPVETYSVNSYLTFEHFVDRKQGLNGVLLVTIVHLDNRLDGSEAQTGECG